MIVSSLYKCRKEMAGGRNGILLGQNWIYNRRVVGSLWATIHLCVTFY